MPRPRKLILVKNVPNTDNSVYGVSPSPPTPLPSPSSTVTEPRPSPPTSSRLSETSSVVSYFFFLKSQSSLSAHTFRVQPGFENDDMKAGQDIHVKWTATSGNVSLPFFTSLLLAYISGLLVYLQRLEYLVVGTSWICIGERLLGVEEYDYEICRTFMV